MDTEKLKGFAGSASRLVATSAQLAKKQAELAALNNVTLPKLYYSVGKRVARLAELPPELAPFRERIKSLEAGVVKSQETTQPAVEEIISGFAAKAKQVAQQVAQKASQATANASAQVQIQAAYVACGKEAVQRFGLRAIPKELQADWTAANDQIEKLFSDIAELQAKNSVGSFTPRRLVFAGGSIAGILLALFLLRSVGGFFFGGSQQRGNALSNSYADTSTQAVSARESDDAPSRAAGIETRMNDTPTASTRPGAAEKVRRFEAECDEICSEMLAAYRVVSNSPRDIVVSAGEKLEELGRNPETRMNGRGISAGCARATMTYLGMCSFISIEAAARCVGQELPDGGMVGMMDSMLTETDERLRGEGNAEEYWTHMALVRASIKLYANSNTFNSDFERQLIEGGAQPVVIHEMQRLRRDISSLLLARYAAGIKYGLAQHGAPPFSER